MKLVILGVGGMGSISLSKTIASMAINRGLAVKSSEIHGMAKKGGLVEIQMKIDEGLSGVVLQGEADFSFVMNKDYTDYGQAFLKRDGRLIMADRDTVEGIVRDLGDVRFVGSFLLARFIGYQDVFREDDALNVLEKLKEGEKNIEAFKRGLI
ncbi:2-oxoacid:acceptor oxidoreductase family protein [Hippea sp. KM1]|uniref:2-oxoacid:acceptor oxidoreductase family protein n=1 Tax=Hippea sp. KM1 TaxID=944481 RepID=UPI00046D44F8|nr:2-oxoacid:acceptor oxidoreductase family protein [Hippea sp. KM1]